MPWSLYQEKMFSCGFCSDGCGLGKTHEIITLILLANMFWDLRDDAEKCTRGTMICCPPTLVRRWLKLLERHLPADYEVHQHGNKWGGFESTTYQKKAAAFKRGHKSVIVVSYH